MTTPNLFKYATSELSQDAFICWLAEWADPSNEAVDLGLHNCGKSLVAGFFGKHGVPVPAIESVEVRKQDRHIDVLIIVNDAYAIIVEDKTSTSNHGDQLAKYLNDVLGRGFGADHVLPIYFKTHDQCHYEGPLRDGYQPFTRADILKFLRPHADHGNAILRDYLANLEDHEERVQSYKVLPIHQWHYWSWVGFYMALGQQIGGVHYWEWVNNPSGAFWGFSWKWASVAGYLLEQDKLTIKIKETDPSRQSQVRNHWHRAAITVGQRESVPWVKPRRFGKGTHMSVAELGQEYRVVNGDNIIDVEATAAGLKKLEPVLDLIATEADDD